MDRADTDREEGERRRGRPDELHLAHFSHILRRVLFHILQQGLKVVLVTPRQAACIQCMRVRVCVCAREWACVRERVRKYVVELRMCACACVRVRVRVRVHVFKI